MFGTASFGSLPVRQFVNFQNKPLTKERVYKIKFKFSKGFKMAAIELFVHG